MTMKKLIISALIATGMALTIISSQSAYAIDLFPEPACSGADCSVVKAGEGELSNKAQNIINMALLLMGGVAVIMIIIGAIRMMVANGDPGNIKSGRLTILWSLVGLAVIILASTIVNIVVDWGWLN